ncbi:MAG: radical SAM protein [Acidiferrobacterales bacterium]|nr:radical SAM protein [Acidiferrobacterales bacterium]
MATTGIPTKLQDQHFQISPDYVRISVAAAIELGLAPGRINGCSCNCINLLQNYPQGCAANCSYCGLARERPGIAEDNSFIRVDWPLYETDLVAEKIAEKESRDTVGRVCIAQVQDHRATEDLIDMAFRVHRASPMVPISALVTATLLSEDDLYRIKDSGVDIIGVGLDAVTADVFERTRGRLAKGPHRWDQHWEIVRAARRIYGPMKVNCHLIVGLGETDKEMFDMIYQLKQEQIAGYLFSFNPEPGTQMQHVPRAPLKRWRRIQFVKNLIEEHDLEPTALEYDAAGALIGVNYPTDPASLVLQNGDAFMTNGCPDRQGVMACNRPYGSYRPGEDFRDYPFLPDRDELEKISAQTQLEQIRAT